PFFRMATKPVPPTCSVTSYPSVRSRVASSAAVRVSCEESSGCSCRSTYRVCASGSTELTCLSSGVFCADAPAENRLKASAERNPSFRNSERRMDSIGGLLVDWIEYHHRSCGQHFALALSYAGVPT